MNDIGILSRLLATVIKDFLQQTFTIIGLLVVIFVRDWRLALIVTVVLPLGGIFIGRFGKKMRKVSRKAQQSLATLVEVLHEDFTGIRIVKAFTMEEAESEEFRVKNEENTKIGLRSAVVSALISPTMELVAGVTIPIIIAYGSSRVMDGSMTPGDFFSFMTALALLYPPLRSISNLHNNMQQALAAAERVFDVLDQANEKDAMGKGLDAPEEVLGGIEYRDVRFRYAGVEEDILKGINLTVKKGEVVALVGSSGSGKTTIVNLLPRFYEIDGGSITIDGTDVREFSLKSLRSKVAVVTQDTILFNDTIRSNIAYGSPDSSEEKIRAAAKAAHADAFIEKQPQGYDSIVGEKGVRLSGGEKQRLSIARAILKDSPILILDEATSSLDTESERIVQDALENLMKNRTTLVIAHRLSTIISADRIVVVHQGRVADVGRHSELLEKSLIYRKLYEMQFGTLEVADAENA